MLLLSPTELEARSLLAKGKGFTFLGRPAARGEGWVLLVSGIGKVNTALALAAWAARHPVDRVLLFGLAGAYEGSGLRPGDLVLAREEVQADLGLEEGLEPLGFPALPGGYYNRFPLDPVWTGLLAQRLGLPQATLLTRDRPSASPEEAQALAGRWGALAENMEGAALAQAALALGLKAAELRAISNPAGVRDKKAWRVKEAFQALEEALLQLIS